MAARPPAIDPLRKIRRLSAVVGMGETPGIAEKARPLGGPATRESEAAILSTPAVYNNGGKTGSKRLMASRDSGRMVCRERPPCRSGRMVCRERPPCRSGSRNRCRFPLPERHRGRSLQKAYRSCVQAVLALDEARFAHRDLTLHHPCQDRKAAVDYADGGRDDGRHPGNLTAEVKSNGIGPVGSRRHRRKVGRGS